MYEPILDMSDNHLKNLYNEIKEANDARNNLVVKPDIVAENIAK
jgi:hypothetical protein